MMQVQMDFFLQFDPFLDDGCFVVVLTAMPTEVDRVCISF